MHHRFFSRNSPRSPKSPRSPRRRLGLFSANEKPKEEMPPCPCLEVEVDQAQEVHETTFGAEIKVPPMSPKEKSRKSPPSSPSKRVQFKEPTAASMLAARRAPPAPLPLPPLMEEPTLEQRRPGVSFQRAKNNDARANKQSTYDAQRVSSSSTSCVDDAVAAKVASYSQRPVTPTQPAPMPRQDPIAAKLQAQTLSPAAGPTTSTYVAPAPLPATPSEEEPTRFMEIAPGHCVRLRGARETWQCVENDFYAPTTCFACDADLCCIMDASYVVCPVCKVVSPVEGWAAGPDGGVGLGFTYADLAQWQQEILQRRQQQQSHQITSY